MYFYYMMSAMGPQYQKYLWWKQHLTTLQMIQFVGIMTHGFQLVFYDDCDFPWQFSYYIGAHAVLFFVLFSEFYIANYLKKRPSATKVIMLSQMPCSSSFTFCMKYEANLYSWYFQEKDVRNGHAKKNDVQEINHNDVKKEKSA